MAGGREVKWSVLFFVNSILLGEGLAMDAFSVSLANGLNEPKMGRRKMCGIAGMFAGFQAAMPMLGWICVHTMVQRFQLLSRGIPWIALLLLSFIGGKMLLEGIRGGEEEAVQTKLGLSVLFLQGVATSIDALSVGFTIADYGALMALVCSLIIAAVTFATSLLGLQIGRQFGTGFSGKASILGGVILIAIGVEIFVTGVF
nr:manganese efflux pump [Suipraeoptans intestinalis]